jgi:hypothetical protein
MMHKQTRYICPIFAVAALLFPSRGLSAQAIRVDKYDGSNITPTQINSVLKDGSAALTTNGGTNRCATDFWLDGQKSTTFDKKYETIHGTKAVEALCNSNGTLNIVKAIKSCDDQGELNTSIEGCYYSGCAVVLWHADKSLTESLFLHEFGHVKGLEHVCGPRFLMNPVLASSQFDLTPVQCTQMMSAPQPGYVETCENNEASSNIIDFVSRHYIHGIPLGEAKKYKPQQLAKIRKMLNDRKAEEFWPNIVAVLGVAGSRKDSLELIKFLNEAPGADGAAYRARLAVPIGLARLSERAAIPEAAPYLTEGLEPEFWLKKKIKLSATDDEENSAEQLAKMTILSLGRVRSKQVDVPQVLNGLKRKHSRFLDYQEVQELIDRSIKYNQSIQ